MEPCPWVFGVYCWRIHYCDVNSVASDTTNSTCFPTFKKDTTNTYFYSSNLRSKKEIRILRLREMKPLQLWKGQTLELN